MLLDLGECRIRDLEPADVRNFIGRISREEPRLAFAIANEIESFCLRPGLSAG